MAEAQQHSQHSQQSQENHQQLILLISAFLIAISGLIYELLAGTVSSYLLGNSVYQFSLTIGLFMTAMGLGAFLSRYINKHLPPAFILLQVFVAGLGGLATPLLFFAFSHLHNYTAFLVLITLCLGTLLGIEIPLIIRILKHNFVLRVNISNVLTADYIGALIAALLFPLVLVPQLGLMQTGFLFALLNSVVGFMAWSMFRHDLGRHKKPLLITLILLTLVLIFGFWQSNKLIHYTENRLYQDEIILAQSSPYQRLVLTKRGERYRFYINGALQFDSYDEYRYHESLIHPALLLARQHERILVLGGGDGMAIREILRYPDVGEIKLVDLDPDITALFQQNIALSELNQHALEHEKVEIINADAWKFLEQDQSLYDVIVIDLPDPNNLSLSRLYSQSFYRLLKQNLSAGGIVVTQATSPLYAQKAFWSISNTLSQEMKHIVPYHVYVPSWGEWGFVMASDQKLDWHYLANDEHYPEDLNYLNAETSQHLTQFPADMEELDVEINTLSNHVLPRYYEAGWNAWFE